MAIIEDLIFSDHCCFEHILNNSLNQAANRLEYLLEHVQFQRSQIEEKCFCIILELIGSATVACFLSNLTTENDLWARRNNNLEKLNIFNFVFE